MRPTAVEVNPANPSERERQFVKASALLNSAATEDQRKILHSLLAFAAGDAFGVAYEYLPEPKSVDPLRMATRGDWPLGGVSDDTHLSLLSIFAVIDDDPAASSDRFLRDLRTALPRLRGLGPTTKAALGLTPDPTEDFLVVGTTVIGNTNGGMMRTSLLGLGFTSAQDAERRHMVATMTRATHTAAAAIDCAILCSALYSRALAAHPAAISDILRAEASQLPSLDSGIVRWLRGIDTWAPPEAGIALDPIETLAAVVWVADRADSQLEGYRLSCELGGDTDTVAALAGGLIAARRPTSTLEDVPWIDDVMWSEIPEIVAAAARLAQMRARR